MGRILDFFSHPSHSRTMGILAFLVLLLAIPLTVNIAQKQQELRQHAAGIEEGSQNTTSADAYNGACYTTEQAAQHPECTPLTDPPTACGQGGQQYRCPFCLFGVVGNCSNSQPASTPKSETASGTQCLDPLTLDINIPKGCAKTGNTCPLSGGFLTGFEVSCSPTAPSLTPQPGVTCDSLNGQCLPPDVGFGDGLTRYYDGNCDNSSYNCFAKYNSSGNIPPSGVVSFCDPSKLGKYGYTCGADAGCKPGEHKAYYTCDNNGGTWAQDQTCYLDSAFPAGSNPCGTGTTGGGIGSDCGDGGYCVASPPLPACQIIPGNCLGAQQCAKKGSCNGNSGLAIPAPPGGTTCNIDSPGTFRYDCSASDCTSGHFAIKVCSAGVEKKDTTCYAGKDFTVNGVNYVNCVAQTPAAPASAKCPETSRTVCQAATNTCAAQGTQTVIYSGQGCTPDSQNVSCPNPAANCNPGNQCPTGGTGACVTKPPTTGGTQLAFTIGLDALGNIGDFPTNQRNSTSANSNPSHKVRKLYFQIFDTAVTSEKANGNTTIEYDLASKKFKGQASLGQTLPAGTYSVKMRGGGYLAKVIKNVQIATAPVALAANLYTGDINEDYVIDPTDYNILLSCSVFSKDNHALCNQNSQWVINSDLNDDGRVDQLDYNLLIREFPAPPNKDQD